MSNPTLEHAYLQGAIELEQLKQGQVNEWAAFLKRIDKELRSKLSQGELTEFSRRRFEAQLREVDTALKTLFDEHFDELSGRLLDIGEVEAHKVVNALEGVGIESALPGASALGAAINSKPLLVEGIGGGLLLAELSKHWTSNERKRITGAIRKGYALGQTNAEILQQIRGTKKSGYKDGILAQTDRHIKTFVRTAMAHVASEARHATEVYNGIEQHKWLATLDSRTSTICRSLDGQIFNADEGPQAPAHYNCRSMRIPYIEGLDEGATRSSEDGYVDGKLSYYEWLKTKDADYQDSVLGKTKGAIFRSDGMSAERFRKLQLDKHFEPVTLAQLRKKIPKTFEAIEHERGLAKKALKAELEASDQQRSLSGWLGEKEYQSVLGEIDKPRVRELAQQYGLTQAEQVAIWHYTKTGFDDLNGYLRGANIDNAEPVAQSVEVLRSALKKLPDYQGIVYRRTTLPAHVLEQHQIGSVISYNEFTSTSYGEEVFLGEHRLIIQSKTGKKITDLSYFKDTEREVLFTSPMSFRVRMRYIASDGIETIRLEEL